MASSPAVSVVVPTHGRPAGLAALMEGLARQTLPRERFELLVVDDGSQPPASAPGADRVIRIDRAGGPAAARNAGWRAASAPLVAFVDDDCVPAPGWLDALVRAAGEPPPGGLVVQGPVEPERRDALTPLAHTIEVAGPSALLASANIAYSRPLLERLGGFDERFRRAGEDVELGARARASGAEVRWAPGALVRHEVRALGLLGTLRQRRSWMESVGVVALHPELRELLFLRVFWKPAHALLLLAAAGAATRRPALALAAAAPYLRHRAREGLGWLPVQVVVDVAEIATALEGSARHRALVL
jgi:glycosyltransferase involved in cell wall biosynthesis